MKKLLIIIFAALLAVCCESSSLDSDSKEELVVEGWIENGHAPVVLVSSTLPVSSEPRPLSGISDHILRYAEVYVEHNGEKNYLTACLTNKYTLRNYFTSSTLKGEVGETYTLHVKWKDFVASSVCTIPAPTPIDTIWYEKSVNDTTYLVKTKFTNDSSEKKYYNSFLREGKADENIFKAVCFSSLDGSALPAEVTCTFTSLFSSGYKAQFDDLHFHRGDTVAVKLASMEKSMYEFWCRYSDIASTTGSTMLSSHSNLLGNVDGAIGYWAGYGISVKELVISDINDSEK